MSISSSANDRKRIAVTRAKETSITTPITLSERSMTGLVLDLRHAGAAMPGSDCYPGRAAPGC